MNISVAVMNVQSGVGTTKGHWQYLTSAWKYILPHSDIFLYRAANILKQESIDIAFCTEVDEISLRSGFKSQTEVLKKHSGISVCKFFPASRIGIFVNEGNAILTNYKITSSKIYRLSGGITSRVLGEITFQIEDKKISAFIVHLGLGTRTRKKQLEEIANIVKTRDNPVILGGDFNEKDISTLNILKSANLPHWSCGKNFPTWKPANSLDYILASTEFTTKQQRILSDVKFSDHLPLIVELSLD